MRRTVPRSFRFLAAATMLVALPTLAGAAVLLQDSFNYSNGPLVGPTPWWAHSGGGAKPIQVNKLTITLQQSTGSGEDVSRQILPLPSATAVTYASFNLKVPAGAVLGTETSSASYSSYFAHFRSNGGDSTSRFVARVFVHGPGTSTTYSLGLSATSVSASGLVVDWPTQLDFGVTYKIVTSYDASTGVATLWVNPDNQGSASITATATPAPTGTIVGTYAFRQASPLGATYTETINDVAVADVFPDVIGPKAPGLGPWGFMLLAVGLLMTGTLFVVRRRATTIA